MIKYGSGDPIVLHGYRSMIEDPMVSMELISQ